MALNFHLLLLLFTLPGAADAFPGSSDAPVASTTSGTLIGKRLTTSLGPVHQFLGVRYARPPIKNLRFRPSEPLPEDAIDGTVDAGSFGASCMQPEHSIDLMYSELNRNESRQPISEDCLFLNIFTPPASSSSAFPVIVWLPGEGFNYASARQFDGSYLALHGQVMVVTVNYRVSAFGFLSTGTKSAPGNAGLTDQLLALKWLRKNVASFGGDANRITLVGRFSGAMSITALLASPLSAPNGQPLFHKAIIQSGVAGEKWTVDPKPMSGVRTLAKKLNCSSTRSTSRMLKCLRSVDAESLNAESAFLYSWRLVKNPSFPEEPLEAVRTGKFLSIPVVIGSTDNEGSLCILTHKVLKTPHLSKLLDDTLDKEEFTVLAKSFLKDYLHIDDDFLAEEATREYEKTSGSWRDRYLRLCGDGYIGHKTRSLARQLSIHGSRVFLYVYSHRPSHSFHPEFVRGAHGDDILFTFGLVHKNPQSTVEERHLSNVMMTAWANFAKASNPNPMLDSNGEEWPAFSVVGKKYWNFSTVDGEQVRSLEEDSVDNFWSLSTKKNWMMTSDSNGDWEENRNNEAFK